MSLRTGGEFNIRDLALDVRLDAIVDGKKTDFTGKKIFSVEFFRQNIGFGITDIEIDVNTSLQPLITITFKDLYGNTIFGKAKNNSPDNTGSDNSDFSILFNWPPPKFMFTFKGYLGKSATWMLNMKKSSVSYDSSDSSYNIKCEFIPNQWGFFSDLPFLFLLAVKSLKKRSLNDTDFKKVQTIFDLIKIGKQVEVKTKETTKEFDNVLKQMTLLKSQRAYDALFISKVINYDEAISGQVGAQTISPFSPVTLVKPTGSDNSDIDSPEKIKALALTAANVRKINTFLLLTAKIGNLNPESISFKDVNVESNSNIIIPKLGDNVQSKISTRIQYISDNITHIEDAIKKKTYDSSKDQLAKITIGEIFEQLAKDAGYIMGRILEAGYQGYFDPQFTDIRNSLKSKLIGRNFPLVLTNDEKKEEKPATKENLGSDVGVDVHEMAFVNDFIDSISEGIATELLSDADVNESVGDNLIKKRINNIEALRQNPYKPFYQNIAENIIVRGGIVAYLTRSSDPNKPGDYDTFFGGDRATNAADVVALADADFENITDSIIGSLTAEDAESLKRFCIFWENFLTEDCENLRQPDTTSSSGGKLIDGLKVSNFVSSPGSVFSSVSISPFNAFGVSDFTILDYPVPIDIPTQWDGLINDANVGKGLSITTLGTLMKTIFRPVSTNGTSLDSTNANFIDLTKLQSIKLINNGIAYSKSPVSVIKDGYVYVMFSGPDASKIKEVTSADSDAEIKNDADKQKDKSKPLGFINIQTPYESDNTTLLPVIEYMNDDKIGENLMLLDYSRMLNPNADFFKNQSSLTGAAYFYVPNKFGDPDNPGLNEIPAKNITLSIAYHPYKGIIDGGNNLIFGPFVGGNASTDSLVHRGFIRRICVKLKEKLLDAEQKKNQIISDVLGKSSEQRDLLYKQMHVLYQQWETLIIKDSSSAENQNSIDTTLGGIRNEMEDRYSNHTNYDMSEAIANEAADNTFLYGYPLNSSTKTKNIKVKDSIISIEPLYKPNGNTTVLNVIQQICTKNNFIFIPMPGEPGSFSTEEIFSPQPVTTPKVKNFFYVQFVPTPESRAKLTNDDNAPVSASEQAKNNLPTGTLEVKFGSSTNQIVKNIQVDTSESKATAESIVNLQRLVDNENQNKTVTTDCSMLPVMEGRSYKATIDMLGNAQVFPMQFFLLDALPLFNGLYQIMKVKHTIKPNDMTTSAEGIRMRMDFQTGDFGGIPPITLDTLANLPVTLIDNTPPVLSQEDFNAAVEDAGPSMGVSDVLINTNVSTTDIILLPTMKAVGGSNRLTQSTDDKGNATGIHDVKTSKIDITKADIVRNMNQFIADVIEPFAIFLKGKYPTLYYHWYFSSAARGYAPPGGSQTSQHFKGQAIDSQIIGGADITATLNSNFQLLNAILEFYRANPSLSYDQILWETRTPNKSWIHWSYARGNNRTQLLRFINDKTYTPAKINGNGRLLAVSTDEVVLKIA